MGLVGIIPAVSNDESPSQIELVPIDYQVVDGERQFRPLVQIIVEGIIQAKVDKIVFVVNHFKMDLMRYYGNGKRLGVPVSYIYSDSSTIAGAIDAAYHEMRGSAVIVGVPGITSVHTVTQTLKIHSETESMVTMSVANNTHVDKDRYIRAITPRQLAGVYIWEPEFTELLRGHMSQHDGETIELDTFVNEVVEKGVRIKAAKLPRLPFVNNADSWVKAVAMAKQARAILMKRLDEVVDVPSD
jgi:NDP-sugar pyrophosphorylase family protein